MRQRVRQQVRQRVRRRRRHPARSLARGFAVGPGLAGVVLAGLFLAAATGCSVRTGPSSDAPDPPVATLDDADRREVWAAVRAAQATRLDGLSTFTSAGTTVLRFTDESGEVRSEQVELRVWRVAPDRAAVRLSKVGASFLLAGWNGPRWWVLDESGDETILRVRRLAGDRPETGAEALLAPPVLLAMIGLLPWPDAVPATLQATRLDDDGRVAGVRFELAEVAWPTPDGPDLAIPGRLVVDVDRFDQGPRRIRLLDAERVVLLDAGLERLESVETLGRPPGGWPVLPHRVRMTRWNGDEISVALDAPLAGGDVSARLFDLDVLRGRHPEAIVVDEVEEPVDRPLATPTTGESEA